MGKSYQTRFYCSACSSISPLMEFVIDTATGDHLIANSMEMDVYEWLMSHANHDAADRPA